MLTETKTANQQLLSDFFLLPLLSYRKDRSVPEETANLLQRMKSEIKYQPLPQFS